MPTSSDEEDIEEQDEEEGSFFHKNWNLATVPRRIIAEVLGTALLVLPKALGGVASEVALPGQVNYTSRGLADGLALLSLILIFGDVSGAHFNPVVSFAFMLRRAFPWYWVPLYWLCQITGGILGALMVKAVFGDVNNLGVPSLSRVTVVQAWGLEALLSFFLVTVILHSSSRGQVLGPQAAFAVAAVVMLAGLLASPLSGAMLNPAVGLGLCFASWDMARSWIWVAGPFLGSTVATAVAYLVHPHLAKRERRAAQGLGRHPPAHEHPHPQQHQAAAAHSEADVA
jgi:aquaporin Z